MPRSHLRHFAILACCFALASAVSSTVRAAELGEVVVRSHIGQQLSADIELVMLTAEDAAGVQVKLAAPNVYQGANTRMHPALSSLRMSVVKRDNRQFLHLTTFQPVEAEILHLFLELGTGNRASVRSATIWLTAEPAPVPAPAQVPLPKTAPLRTAAPEPASAVASMMAADAALAAQSMQAAQSAESRAVALRAARMRAAAQNAMLAKESPDAAKKGAAEQVSGAAAIAAASAAAVPAATAKPGPAAIPITLGPEARAKRGAPGGAKAACTPGQSAGEAQQCLALDQTNAELKTKLIDLEGKVKLLQAALGQSAGATAAALPVAATAATASGAASAASASASAVPGTPAAAVASAAAAASAGAAPAAAAAPAPGKPAAKKKASGINNTTMILGGVLLLALVLGLLVYIIRKKKFKFSTAPLKVWQGWRKDKKPAAAEAPAAAEPILNNE